MTASDPYGYDARTDTVRVSRHDLARLLLEFRALLERAGRDGGGPAWLHMVDYDKSFARLADAVDHGRTHYARAHYPPERAADIGRPDYRMRCKRTPVYGWPGHAPYDGGQVQAVKIRSGSVNGETPAAASHYVYWDDGPRVSAWPGHALCGFAFTREDGVTAVTGPPSCLICVRERTLAAALGGGQ